MTTSVIEAPNVTAPETDVEDTESNMSGTPNSMSGIKIEMNLFVGVSFAGSALAQRPVKSFPRNGYTTSGIFWEYSSQSLVNRDLPSVQVVPPMFIANPAVPRTRSAKRRDREDTS